MLENLVENPSDIELSKYIRYWKNVEGKTNDKGNSFSKMPSQGLPRAPIDYMVNQFFAPNVSYMPYWNEMSKYTSNNVESWEKLGLFDPLTSGSSVMFDKFGNAIKTATFSLAPTIREPLKRAQINSDELHFEFTPSDLYEPKEIKHF